MPETTYYLQTSEYQSQMFEHLGTCNSSGKLGTTEEWRVESVSADYSH